MLCFFDFFVCFAATYGDGSVDASELPRWAADVDDDQQFDDDDQFDIGPGTSSGSHFPMNNELNEKIAVW